MTKGKRKYLVKLATRVAVLGLFVDLGKQFKVKNGKAKRHG